jgi:hypothetical protein
VRDCGISPIKVDINTAERGPLLLTLGGQRRAVRKVTTKETVKQYRKTSRPFADIEEFPWRARSPTIDSDWSDVTA